MRLELKCATATREAEGGRPSRSDAGTGDATDAAAMLADAEYYSLHLYKLKHLPVDTMRQRLGTLCRLYRVAPDRLAGAAKRQQRLVDTLAELKEFATAVVEAAGLHVSSVPADDKLPISSDWRVIDALQSWRQRVVEAEEKANICEVQLAELTTTLLAGLQSAGDLETNAELPVERVAPMLATMLAAYGRLKRASRAWSEAEALLMGQVW